MTIEELRSEGIRIQALIVNCDPSGRVALLHEETSKLPESARETVLIFATIHHIADARQNSPMSEPKRNGQTDSSPWWRPLVSVLIVVVLLAAFVFASFYVHWSLLLVLGVLALLILIVAQAVELKREGNLSDKTFGAIMLAVITRATKKLPFTFSAGGDKGEPRP